MTKILNVLAVLLLILSSCSSNSDVIVDFSESEMGFEKAYDLILKSETEINSFFNDLKNNYKSSSEINGIKSTLDEKVTLKVNYEMTGPKITRVNYLFDFENEEKKSTLESDLKTILSSNFNQNGISKKNSIIKYELSSSLKGTNGFVRISFIYDYYSIKADLVKQIEKYTNKYPPTSEFTLTHFEGKQIIPKNEIWIIKEVHRCVPESSFTSNRKDLQTGGRFNCEPGVTSDNTYIYYDLILNNKCLRANGPLTSDSTLTRSFSGDFLAFYYDPEIYEKISVGSNMILFPGMSLCVSEPSQVSKRVLIEMYKIDKIKSASDYISFTNEFMFDKTKFNYLQFMGYNSLMFKE